MNLKPLKILSLIGLLFLCFNLKAQQAFVAVNLLPHGTPFFSSHDIWNSSVQVTGGSGEFTAYYRGEIYNSRNELVAQLESESFRLTQGVNVFNQGQIQTSVLRYRNGDMASYEQMTGHLPATDYEYCIELVCQTADRECITQLTDRPTKTCMQVHVPITTPLLLSIPADESKLKNTRPDFTWIAPMPVGADPNVTYSFNLVKLREDQSAESGIRRNRSLHTQRGISGVFLPFPAELDNLEEGERYAWQVEAWIGKTYLATSEVWEFEIIEEKEKIEMMPFVRIKKYDKGIYNAVNELRFIYHDYQNGGDMQARIFNSNGQEITPNGFNLISVPGEKKFTIDLRSFNFKQGEIYKLKITSLGGEEYELSFRYIYQM